MQSLLFGTNGLNIFSNSNIQQEMMLHLTHICRIAQQLNAKFLVFGSPLNRDRSHLSDHLANAVAQSFFSHLGDIAQSYGVTICLEPNPSCYNCNFMTNSKETASIVKLVNHENIKMQLDIGSMYINNEDPELIVPEVAHLIGHIHISEPRLAALNPDNDYHVMVAPLIRKYLADKVLTIEMLTSSKKATLDEVEESLKFVKNTYLPEQSL
ncbi:Sugar phosphate isomerase/epimerase [Vibrio crassostreae]|uniref:sugar phosphate isomerase/epimerase family protein n=1 Tax=Vibrio crassostreae TaxID=246167 RepID=UPI0010E5411E|nr:TIM barrel protein [Vibrio crassostreae]TCN84424.1 sugar phosphate isomerase/epimerase [Vibrio crassostreae]CAK2409727.1 Sugar phosphate isomerase/epimerase [Vibrio crassostreae]CAK2414236.1 Sugar phosphate isomerase/epimerase [Vibrio crassostreae]CAK3610752.1 Sugar phosphate isomerase/epimerase [Vibrio crassostreae]CAK3796815.1 Sugar phosphate isomerase/epimerase [Vibrio crassostreae]